MPINNHAARKETETGELVDTELSPVSIRDKKQSA